MSVVASSVLKNLQRSHEGRIFWFKTVHFSKPDLSRLPGFAPNRLSRRATNYLLLGLSIPSVLDVHPSQGSTSTNPAIVQEFLRSLNTLLTEFEAYQQLHPTDGGSGSTLSRARLPHMFKRATQATTGKGRRTSNAAGADIGLPLQPSISGPTIAPSSTSEAHHPHHGPSPSLDAATASNAHASPSNITPTLLTTAQLSFPSAYSSTPSPSDTHPNSTLHPSETPYTHLLTPPLPFSPDFHAVFATLCDVLIDAYQRIMSLVSTPNVCTVAVGELFSKADARLRKVIVGGIVKEFEGAAREWGRREVLGVQRVVLGGLMGG